MPGLVTLGEIASPYGKNGAVVFRPEYDLKIDLLGDLKVFLAPPLAKINYLTVNKALARGKRLILFFKEITSINLAENIVGRKIQVDSDNFQKLIILSKESPIGFACVLEDKTVVGEVVDVIYTPAHRVLIIKRANNEILVPEVPEFVENIDYEEQIVFLKKQEYLRNWNEE
jgi:16S rRNA processing protein RimM